MRVLPGLVLFVVSVEAAAPTPLPMPEPARLTPEMIVWLDARVPRVGSDDAVLDALLVTLVTDPELALNYDPGFTAPAAEVFAQGRFNCLSFAHLFLGMARTRGIPVEYLQVPPRRFVRDGDLVLASGHVTVGYGRGPRRRVLDIGTLPGADLQRAAPISDRRAHALHWVNLGAERLLEGDHEGAESRFLRALEIEPELGPAWTNLGVVRRRRGDLAAAETMYRRAIEADGEHLVAYENLFSLLVLQSRDDAAREVERLIVRRAPRSPFAWLALGDFSLARGRTDDAARFLRRAYRLDPGDPEILAARGELELAHGRLERSRRWLREAEHAAPGHPRVERLARALAGEAPLSP